VRVRPYPFPRTSQRRKQVPGSFDAVTKFWVLRPQAVLKAGEAAGAGAGIPAGAATAAGAPTGEAVAWLFSSSTGSGIVKSIVQVGW